MASGIIVRHMYVGGGSFTDDGAIVCDACEPRTERAAERFSPAEEDYSATIWIATEELTSACT